MNTRSQLGMESNFRLVSSPLHVMPWWRHERNMCLHVLETIFWYTQGKGTRFVVKTRRLQGDF